MKKLSIKNWALDDRPREKLLNKGVENLTDAELLAIIISSGNREESAVELSRRILISFDNNLNSLGKSSVRDFMKFKGIGEAKAITIVAALELGRRRKLAEVLKKTEILSDKDAFEFFYSFMGDLEYEEFWVLMLNNKNSILDKRKIGQGGINSTIVDVRMIMKYAIESLATNIILCHNHPSGNLEPSSQDIEISKKIFEAGKILDINILDHIIIGNKDYFSFKSNNLIF